MMTIIRNKRNCCVLYCCWWWSWLLLSIILAIGLSSDHHHVVEAFVVFPRTTTAVHNHRRPIRRRRPSSSGFCCCSASSLSSVTSSPYLSAEYVYFDIQVNKVDLGRLVFRLTIPSTLPNHAENLVQLATTGRYDNCVFDFGPDYCELEGRYRWRHVLRGPTRNAVGFDNPIVDPASLVDNTHSCFGGQYYGDEYYDDGDDTVVVLLAVACQGPGRGSPRFSIIRVGESPSSWKSRLLLNAGVIGTLYDGIETLHAMARQREGPPPIVQAGVLQQQQPDQQQQVLQEGEQQEGVE